MRPVWLASAWLLACSAPEDRRGASPVEPLAGAAVRPTPSDATVDAVLDAARDAPVDAAVALVDAGADARARPTFAVLHALPGIDILESVTRARHVHGGPPANVGRAAIRVRVRDARPHTIEVMRLELLHGHCRETTWFRREALAPAGYDVHDWDHVDPVATGTRRVTLPANPDLYVVSVRFSGVAVYQACDRFAFAVRLVVDGKRALVLEVPLQVTRFEPLRRP